ncbi:MAG: SDR family NAD(P)-dependent oxidoreductase [Beijerinckiaceae bacterium]|nr:SDR family NAD(P)-dependent oxidoreductase [Beijerinckiaceae bacterium]
MTAPSDLTNLENMPGRGRLAGKTVLVIGGGSIGPGWGNGKAAAVVYAREGARVAVVDRREDAAQETVDIIRPAGGEAIALSGDVTDEADVAQIVSATIEAFGRLDVLHNNVGGSGTGKRLDNITLGDWNETFARNVTSAMLTSRAVVPHMERTGGGSIINISSVSSIRHLGVPTAVYSAAKGALNELTKNIAVEYARKQIRANCILPGYIDTPFIRRDIGGVPSYKRKGFESAEIYAAARNEIVPMGRMGSGWDVAYAALFFASDESAYVTGQMLVVDGGVTSTCPGV